MTTVFLLVHLTFLFSLCFVPHAFYLNLFPIFGTVSFFWHAVKYYFLPWKSFCVDSHYDCFKIGLPVSVRFFYLLLNLHISLSLFPHNCSSASHFKLYFSVTSLQCDTELFVFIRRMWMMTVHFLYRPLKVRYFFSITI